MKVKKCREKRWRKKTSDKGKKWVDLGNMLPAKKEKRNRHLVLLFFFLEATASVSYHCIKEQSKEESGQKSLWGELFDANLTFSPSRLSAIIRHDLCTSGSTITAWHCCVCVWCWIECVLSKWVPMQSVVSASWHVTDWINNSHEASWHDPPTLKQKSECNREGRGTYWDLYLCSMHACPHC